MSQGKLRCFFVELTDAATENFATAINMAAQAFLPSSPAPQPKIPSSPELPPPQMESASPAIEPPAQEEEVVASIARMSRADRMTEPEREEYYDLLLRFREHCAERQTKFQEGMRKALAAAMGERPTVAPADARTQERKMQRGDARTGGWSPERKAKFQATMREKQKLKPASAQDGNGRPRFGGSDL